MLKKLLLVGAGLGFFSTAAMAGGNGLLGPSEDPSDGPYQKGTCQIPQKTLGQFQGALNNVVTMHNGGIFKPNMMWLAVVDRSGTLCLVIKSQAGSSPGCRRGVC